jgi:hypothetical protein
MVKVTIVDSIMGSGKTSWAIQFMKLNASKYRFIFVTPFLTEVERIKTQIPNCQFYDPENRGKGKLDSLKMLVRNGFNIATTHRLFEMVDLELICLIAEKGYILIQDEVLDVISPFELKKNDFDLLREANMVSVTPETGVINWNDKTPYKDTKYNDLKRYSETENLIYFQDSILFWTFPIAAFKAFKHIYVLTYLFEGADQKYYFDMNSIEYQYKAVKQLNWEAYDLTDTIVNNNQEHIRKMISIYSGKLNEIGKEDYSLSKSWFEKEQKKDHVNQMTKNLSTYFKNNVKTRSQVNMWTCFKDHETKLKGKGYSKGFVPLNSRATNEFQDKQSLAYVINRFMHPYKYKFFQSRGLKVDQDLWALSELIQWIWRSRIRKGEPINLYIPSKRMRNLLKRYLDSSL